ncbi:MAG: class I SAM-dependent methyltransferase [Candidatus Daviesbacteria bacterium]|nr:class I SAM-dependent methyltransferase [Candidatus Daviesbacteria bacterium]
MLYVEKAEEARQIERFISGSWRYFAGRIEVGKTSRDLDEYCQTLPTFQKKTIAEHIEERIHDGAETVTILDIGCGQGICLARLTKNYPQVRTIGLSAADFRPLAPTPWQPYINKVDYRIEDAHKLAEVISSLTPDFIVSLHAFEYFADPLCVLQQAYGLLAMDGILFVDTAGLYLTGDEADTLKNLWKQSGAEAELSRWTPGHALKSLHSPAIQKKAHAKLPLPFRYNFPALGHSITHIYSFDPTKAAANC